MSSDKDLYDIALGRLKPDTGRSTATIAAELENNAVERQRSCCDCGVEFTGPHWMVRCKSCYRLAKFRNR